MNTDFCHAFDGGGADAAHVGSKAAALDRLATAGVPVPEASALCAEAYEAYVEAGGLGKLLGGLPASVAPEALAADANRVERAFLETSLPSAVKDAIEEAYERVSGGAPVAVRSSATAEDLATASFAGQYRSFLGVDDSGLERAVRLCRASLWAPGARAYRQALDPAGHLLGESLLCL